MDRQRVAMVAAAALLGSLALSACSGSASGTATAGGGQVSVSASGTASGSGGAGGSSGSGSSGTAGTGGSSTAPGGGSAGTGGSGSGSSTGSGSGSSSGSGSASGSGSGSASGTGIAARCTTAHLGFSIGPDSGPQSVGDTTAAEVVKLTNKGGAACALDGFPGVDLRTNAGTFSVPRSKKTPKPVTLAPGASALFSIDYTVNNTGGSGIRVETMVITPPNETHSATLAWDQGTLPVTDGSGSFIDVDPVVSFS
jgi:hypothetical protein